MPISFSKYHGSGNDFIIIDDRAVSFPSDNKELIAQLCHRRFGIGADGLILLQPSTLFHYRMRIFNCDGMEAAMCGNGLRCLVHFINSLGLSEDVLCVETMHGMVRCSINGEKITIQINRPYTISQSLCVDVGTERFHFCVVNTGVPHAVIFVKDVSCVDVQNVGRSIRYDKVLPDEGANVNFVQILSSDSLKIRTYERGIEGETMSCGTGAAAAAYAALKEGCVTAPLKIIPLSAEPLWVNVEHEGAEVMHMYLAGGAVKMFEGKLS